MLEFNSSMFVQTFATARTAKVRTGWPYMWFWKFFYRFSPRVLRSSWILNKCNFCCKIVKYCILSEVYMIKTVPHDTLSPQMWCTNGIKGWFTHNQSWLVFTVGLHGWFTWLVYTWMVYTRLVYTQPKISFIYLHLNAPQLFFIQEGKTPALRSVGTYLLYS